MNGWNDLRLHPRIPIKARHTINLEADAHHDINLCAPHLDARTPCIGIRAIRHLQSLGFPNVTC